MYDYLSDKVEVKTSLPVERILVEDGKVKGVKLRNGEEVESKFVVVAPGRVGADWLRRECLRLNLPVENNPVDQGVRVEFPASNNG